jgi:PAS domain S-box-containing protein
MPIRFGSLFVTSNTRRTLLTLLGGWTLVFAGFLGLNQYYSNQEDRQIALNRAKDAFRKDLVYRRWAAERGGVYVPMDEKTPANPHLTHLPNRDITTPQGLRLTLVNPAYLTRMVHELEASDTKVVSHLTSLKPIRPENAPDPWERRALAAFEQGAREYSEVITDQGKPFLRYMGAFLVEPGCLSCHAQLGYKVGEIRGGMSITTPLGDGALGNGLNHRQVSAIALMGCWLLGTVGILLWVRRLNGFALEHQAMLAELKDGSQRFRQLFKSSPAPMFIHRDGRIIDANREATRLLEGADLSQVIGLNLMDHIHPKYREVVAERMRQVHEIEGPTPLLEEIFLTLKGREVPVAVQTVHLDLPDGAATLAFTQDLTERKHNEEERRKLETEIQHAQKLDSLGSLAGGIAHDMNNVLAAILGMATLLQIKRDGDESLIKSLRTIENAAGRGRDLVKGLTDFARKGLQQAKEMDLNALIRKELDLLIRTSRQRYTFEVQLEEPLPRILGESSTLGSAFMNLCVNAFDAMPKGGSLTIRTTIEEGWVCLLVADTGEGIPADILHRVTEPFFTTKPPGRGTGLGLAMVYGTVKAHGGVLEIQSEVGKGTRILMKFPPVATGPTAEVAGDQANMKPERLLQVLLVDDDALIRDILPPMLEQLGHRVVSASSGLEAIRRLDAGLQADLVILDHNMPGMTGAETLPRIFQLRPELRVIIATGFLDTELKMLLSSFPAVLTLQKPFSLEELRQMLQGL